MASAGSKFIEIDAGDLQRISNAAFGGRRGAAFVKNYTVSGAMGPTARKIVTATLSHHAPKKTGTLRKTLQVREHGNTLQWYCLFYGMIVDRGFPRYDIYPKDGIRKVVPVTRTMRSRYKHNRGKLTTLQYQFTTPRVMTFLFHGYIVHVQHVVHPKIEGTRWIYRSVVESMYILQAVQERIGTRLISVIEDDTLELDEAWIDSVANRLAPTDEEED